MDQEDDDDFEEEEVWEMVKERRDGGSPKTSRRSKDEHRFSPSSSSSSSSSTSRRHISASSRMIPRSSAHQDTGRALQQSAPVNIPDWSKIYKQKGHGHDYDGDEEVVGDRDGDEDEEEDDGGDKVPPHEWIAKKLARTQISSFSVCEGAGRTLKGRDLSKVRNAVLTRTGFLE